MTNSRTAVVVIMLASLAPANAATDGFSHAFPTRSIDGSGNNERHPEWGQVGSQLIRLGKAHYADGISRPAGDDRPNPRTISNIVCAQVTMVPNPARASDFIWQWGQFIDHDTTLADPAVPAEVFNVLVPAGDAIFDPDGTGEVEILVDRSAHDPATGTSTTNPRQQVESITSYIDASMVYGSDAKHAAGLRTLDGTGRLKSSDGNLLPFNVDGFPNLGGPDPSLFLAGDIRANEQIGLTAMHTLWMREHNRHAKLIAAANPSWSGEAIYQRARAIVGAEIQVITYNEFLPILIGADAIPEYAGYDPEVDASISNEFATAAYRVGHTLLSPQLMRLDANGDEWMYGHVPLREAFFAVHRITDEGGIEPILRGLGAQMAQNIDPMIVDDVRNFLFGRPGAGGFDLAVLNLQRGRDHGLPTYNEMRNDMGMPVAATFRDVTSDPTFERALADAYGDVDDIDLWVGGLAEDQFPGASVGELFRHIIADQFRRLRDGDRFWHERVFPSGPIRRQLDRVRLSDVIRWNTTIAGELRRDVFHVTPECPADLNGDGVVDAMDVLAMVEAMGESDHPADLNGDGLVDIDDLTLLLAAVGPCPA